MAVEIELKARLDDHLPVKERISALGEYCRSYTKTDVYWLPAPEGATPEGATPEGATPEGATPEGATPEGGWRTDVGQLSLPSGVRVRREKGANADGAAFDAILVTYKTKEVSDGIEVNDECEFTVSDAAPFEELLRRLGLREAIRKEKQGWAWLVPPPPAAGQPPILAELSQVAGLGWFLEIEIQVAAAAANDDRQTVAESRRRLLALLEQLEIPAEQIEARPYTQMLQEIV